MAKNLEKDLTGMGKSAAGGIPILGGLGSSIGALPLPAMAAAAAVGILAVAGKSMVEIGDKWEASQKGLKQATDALGISNDTARQFVDKFIGSNTKYISSQAEVVDSYAALTREGLSQKKVQEDLNLALDLSALKHISLTDATVLLQQAEMGRGRALIPLGINMKEYPVLTESATQAAHKLEAAEKAVEKAQLAHTAAVRAHGPHSAQAQAAARALADANARLAEAHNYAAARAKASAEVHDLLHKKLDDGRKSTSDLEQAQKQLGNAWQTFAHTVAPVLLGALTLIFQALNHIFEAIGWVIDRFAGLAGAGESAATRAAAAVNIAAGQQGIATGRFAHPTTHRQTGGSVNPYGDYIVGESGPELLHMGSQGGTIIPHGAGGGRMTVNNVNINIAHGAYIDGPSVDRLANTIAQRLTYATGR